MTAVARLDARRRPALAVVAVFFVAVWSLVAPMAATAVVIDFETLVAGHILQSSDWPAGTILTVDNAVPGHPDKAIIFDSDCTIGTCTGGDDDLRTPGTGPGNTVPQGKIMIIAEDVVDVSPADGIVDDPDDENGGGVIRLTFTVPYKFLEIRAIIDFQPGEEPSLVEVDPADGGPTQTFTIPTLGDNSASTIGFLSAVSASEIRFIFGGSGGLDEIVLVTACGDGIIDFGEECDDAGANSDVLPDACRTDCTLPVCGDNVVDTGEECDPPDGTTCDVDCMDIATDCGNGVVDPGEECDDGLGNSDVDPDACRTDCTLPGCGDGVTDTGEECDDGAGNSDTEPDACRTDCTLPICGDGVIDTGEACDPPDGTTCDAFCGIISQTCGDANVDPGEECDDGADNSDTEPDACRTDCTLPICGDGVTDTGEECDDGTGNSDTDPDACRVDCVLPFCGDGVTDGGEQCDPPDDSITCDSNCMSTLCGNGVIDPGEECDPPDGNTCDELCMIVCGNGVIDPGEECDPGGGEICDNLVDDDGDGLIDCHDPECSMAIDPTCNEDCEEISACKILKRDPATIKFKGGGLDQFSIHARVDASPGDFDPNAVGFGIALYNDEGVILQAFVPPGSFIEKGVKNGFPTRYKFKDTSARSLGEASLAQGIFRSNMRFRQVCGEPAYTAQIRVYADLSEATSAKMTTQYYHVDDVGSLTAEWVRKPRDESQPLRGWKLQLFNLPGASNPGACN